MTPGEAATALALCAAYDNRTVSESTARAWAEALPDVTLADARVVIVEHYRERSVWLMPSHVLDGVRRLREARWREHGEQLPAPPRELDDDPRAQIAWTRAYRSAVGDGCPRELADRRACEQLRVEREVEGPTRPAVAAHVEARAAQLVKRPPRGEG